MNKVTTTIIKPEFLHSELLPPPLNTQRIACLLPSKK
jgi:hypothetical protein